MPQAERWHHRDEAYSEWHRLRSISRFMTEAQARQLGMIDVDVTLYCEYQDGSKIPVCLIETALDHGQKWKEAKVTANLAQMADILGFCVLYRLGDTPLPGNPLLRDIVALRVRQLAPHETRIWTPYTPAAWAQELLTLRQGQRQMRPPAELTTRQLTERTGLCTRCRRYVPIRLIFKGECEQCQHQPQGGALHGHSLC